MHSGFASIRCCTFVPIGSQHHDSTFLHQSPANTPAVATSGGDSHPQAFTAPCPLGICSPTAHTGCQFLRKQSNSLSSASRLIELLDLPARNAQQQAEANNLCHKLHFPALASTSIGDFRPLLQATIDNLQKTLAQEAEQQKQAKLQQWQRNTQYDEHSRSKWLHRTTFLQRPAIKHDGNTLQTDQPVLRAIHKHWTEHWQEAHATPAIQKINHTTANLPSFPSLQDRPSPAEFAKARKRLRGAAGPDGWIAEELQWLPAPIDEWFCNISHIWEQAGRIPTALQFSRQINLIKPAKVHNGTTTPKDLRPINVYSLFYRWWSSTCARSALITSWRTQTLPPSIVGGLGSAGTEELASQLADSLRSKGYLASLD